METNKIFNLLGTWVISLGLGSVASALPILYAPNSTGTMDPVAAIQPASYGSSTLTASDGSSFSLVGEMTVQIFFADGTSSLPILWTTNSTCNTSTPGKFGEAGCGLATATVGNGAWTLTETGNTGDSIPSNNPDIGGQNAWTLSYSNTQTAIASVSLSGINSPTSGALFGRDLLGTTTHSGLEGTPGDLGGLDMTFASNTGPNSPYTVTAQYTNIVTEPKYGSTLCLNGWDNGGANHIGTNGCQDEFRTLNFTFSNASTNSFVGTSPTSPITFAFFQDTDFADSPEPATIVLTGVGLLGLIAARKRLRGILSR